MDQVTLVILAVEVVVAGVVLSLIFRHNFRTGMWKWENFNKRRTKLRGVR